MRLLNTPATFKPVCLLEETFIMFAAAPGKPNDTSVVIDYVNGRYTIRMEVIVQRFYAVHVYVKSKYTLMPSGLPCCSGQLL